MVRRDDARFAPTLVLTGGQVLTVDAGFTATEGVAVRGSRIVATGSDADIRALTGPGTRIVALGGRTAGELHARVSVLLPAPIGGSAADVRKGLEELRRPHSADPRLLNAIGVKIFADGVPPNRTAWMTSRTGTAATTPSTATSSRRPGRPVRAPGPR
ncbi:hypothetical protein [Streptomyces acidiscabies]|uniref:hypothetical protein n=1 Tax=Streptomyces acidiscabies TaxID=42234 RepID=UPI0009523A8D|nr:hypothetical protein [Streptomyces acidiscabies]